MRKKRLYTLFVLAVAFFLWACGIEDFPIIDPVPDGSVFRQMNDRASVPLPDDYYGSPFTHFEIYYSIYISNAYQPSTGPDTFPAINSRLAQHFNEFNQYIDSTTHVNVDMERVFQNRGYYLLELQEENIREVLSSSVWGKQLVFDFPTGIAPTMTVDGTSYILCRSTGDGGRRFDPEPQDRLFRNRNELSSSENINDSTINLDVEDMPNIADGIPRYTFAAMYITAVGYNPNTYANIFSTPALIHVFQLPD